MPRVKTEEDEEPVGDSSIAAVAAAVVRVDMCMFTCRTSKQANDKTCSVCASLLLLLTASTDYWQ